MTTTPAEAASLASREIVEVLELAFFAGDHATAAAAVLDRMVRLDDPDGTLAPLVVVGVAQVLAKFSSCFDQSVLRSYLETVVDHLPIEAAVKDDEIRRGVGL